MRWSTQNVRKRDTRITVSQISTGRNAYENGRVKTGASEFTTLSFWGDVTDMKDGQGDIREEGGKRLDSRVVKIEADSRSTSSVNIADTLTLDNSTDIFEIIDKYDSTFRYSSVIIAKYKK